MVSRDMALAPTLRQKVVAAIATIFLSSIVIGTGVAVFLVLHQAIAGAFAEEAPLFGVMLIFLAFSVLSWLAWLLSWVFLPPRILSYVCARDERLKCEAVLLNGQRVFQENMRIAEEIAAGTTAKLTISEVLNRARMDAAADRDDWINSAQPLPPPLHKNVGVFQRYRSAGDFHRSLIRSAYMRALEHAHPRHDLYAAIPAADLVGDTRYLYLAATIDADDGNLGYAFLDLDASDVDRCRFVYRSRFGLPNFERWQKSLPAISSYLGGRWRVDRGGGTAIVLTALPDVPDVVHLDAAHLVRDHLFLGVDLNTGKPHQLPIGGMTHTLMQGANGLGKTTFMHMVMASIVMNLDRFEAVTLVDLKYGLGALPYAALHPKFEVIDSHDSVPPLIERLEQLMEARALDMRDRHIDHWDGGTALVIVDEFSDLLLAVDKPADRTKLENKLIRLVSKSRSMGIRFWIQVQNATADAVPPSFKRNLTTRIAFRQTNTEATNMFASTETMPADLPTLRKGQVIYQDGNTSDRYALQAALVTFRDVQDLALRLGLAQVSETEQNDVAPG